MNYFVYVIRSIEGFTYTGMTENLERRLKEHNERTLSFWTKRGTQWEIIYSETFALRQEALKKEKWLKSGIGREFIKTIDLSQ